VNRWHGLVVTIAGAVVFALLGDTLLSGLAISAYVVGAVTLVIQKRDLKKVEENRLPAALGSNRGQRQPPALRFHSFFTA
jgi:hypothetical protein